VQSYDGAELRVRALSWDGEAVVVEDLMDSMVAVKAHGQIAIDLVLFGAGHWGSGNKFSEASGRNGGGNEWQSAQQTLTLLRGLVSHRSPWRERDSIA
jgi:hypothetical protein